MTVTLEERVEVLEGKVENLQVLADFRREVNGKLARFDKAQEKQSQALDIHTGKLNGLESSAKGLKFDMLMAGGGAREFKEEVSGKLERLDNDITWLKGSTGRHDTLLEALSKDVADLGDGVTGLTVKADRLQADVNSLKSEVAEFKVEVRGTLAEILDRLPPKAA